MKNSLEDRIVSAAEILQTTSDKIKESLEFMGLSEDPEDIMLLESDNTTLEDFDTATTEAGINAKLPRLRAAWAILKGKDPFAPKTEPVQSIIKPIGQWKDEELLQSYSKNCPLEVEEELKKRTRGFPVIIFDTDNIIDIDNSLKMIRMARRQTTPKSFMVSGKLKQVYQIGLFPKEVFHECPIHSHILLVEGYCEACSKTWDTSEYEKNVFIRLIVKATAGIKRLNDTGVVEPATIGFMRSLKKDNLETLKEDFPDIFLEYLKLKEEGKLPSLKRRVSKANPADPFHPQVHMSY